MGSSTTTKPPAAGQVPATYFKVSHKLCNHGKNAWFKPAPSEINYGKMRFLITDRPTDYTIVQYIDELKKHSAKVRRDFRCSCTNPC